ncbi:hypothetical protein G7Y41_00375 [Schaalia sp. ZJ405]|uniref:hypothetical protein n=1 Tax=Schaalia sp. ZJ405 TaxID=2709403 RepID=UPI0013ED2E91|nr:hypothetical protein [Schaalia sp. ZJ405]QPK81380.1 hypothetical protein G7Y41_00375 [Schaalia sp. ZJ405]
MSILADALAPICAGSTVLVLFVICAGDVVFRAQRLIRSVPRCGNEDESASYVEQPGKRMSQRAYSWGVEGADLALMVAEVSARLRAGAPVTQAWARTWADRGDGREFSGVDEMGVPHVVRDDARKMRARDIRGPAQVIRWWRGRTYAGRARIRAARGLVAACSLTGQLGAPLADVLDAIADGIDESEQAEEARRIAGSGPRASARILSALPLGGIGVAVMLGADPLGMLTSGGLGTVGGCVGAACFIAGHVVSRRMLRKALSGDEDVDQAILCDLAVAGLESGASIPATCSAIGVAIGSDVLARTGKELTLGVDWERAWEECVGPQRVLYESLRSAWNDGTSPIPLLRRAAHQIRCRRITQARTRAEELGVRLAMPLAGLLLPAFVLLGVVPLVVYFGREGFGGFL